MDTTSAVADGGALRSVALPDICTVEAYASHVGLSPATVRAQLRDGRLPGRRVGRRWLIARLALIAHLAAPTPARANLRSTARVGATEVRS